MQDGNAKQQIVERIKSANTILVTVSSSPSVDELAAALGFTLMLNKLDKHATAVFSGEIPHAIAFLKPDKTFESSVDSLRDFIIALDKDKADRLRYKVEEDVVRIYITPYRTTITEKDLDFSQGDFNVELIVALGVEKSDDIDKAIAAHGRILHDATVVTVNSKAGRSSLGSIDWNEPDASSLCEMLMSLSEALQPNLLDEQIANSLLTGIVAATERFSNQHTTPRVMTMAAQLMAAGANQQLIATKLQEDHVIGGGQNSDGSMDLKEGAHSKVKKADDKKPQDQPAEKKKDLGEMRVAHDPAKAKAKAAAAQAEELAKQAEEELQKSLETAVPANTTASAVEDLRQEVAQASDEPDDSNEPENDDDSPSDDGPALPAPVSSPANDDQPTSQAPVYHEPKIMHDKKPSWMSSNAQPPTMGSPLSATAQEALEKSEKEQEENRKKAILHHDDQEAPSEPSQEEGAFSNAAIDMQFEEAPITLPPAPAPASVDDAFADTPVAASPTIDDLAAQAHAAAAPVEAKNDDLVDQARQAVSDALSMPPAEPVAASPALDTAVFTPDVSPAEAPLPPLADQNPPQFMPNELPPLPDFSTLPPLPGDAPVASDTAFIDPNAAGGVPTPPPLPIAAPQEPAENNPGQFRIPGQ